MGIPTATHSITVARRGEPTGWGDPEAEPTQLASGVRAVLYAPSGSEVDATEGTVMLRLVCDEVEGLDHRCIVTDETTGVVYDVVWAVRKPSLLGVHMEAGLQAVTGAAVAGR